MSRGGTRERGRGGWGERRGEGRGGKERAREGGGAGGAKSRTQLTNMGKIPANEDGQSSGDLVRWRDEGGEEGL